MKTILNTNKGKIIIELNIQNRPITTSNFIKLAKDGFYNGIRFHRVIAGFMIQGGDPLSADLSKKDLWGTGGPDYMFNDEIDNQNNNIKYSISMANRGPNTNGSQWFINTNDNHFLNDKHTVFGQVIEGQDIVNDIEMQATDFSDKPIHDIIIENIDILE